MIVEHATEVGTHADAALCASTVANAPAESAVPCQPLCQDRPRPRQPSGHRSFGAAELLCRLLAGLALQVAEDNGDTIQVRQAAQLLVQQRSQIVIRDLTATQGANEDVCAIMKRLVAQTHEESEE